MLAACKQALQRFRAKSKSKGDDKEREIEKPAPSGIEDPVEGGGQDEEGDEMQDLLVDLRDLGRTEMYICSSEEDKEECAWVGGGGSGW